MIQANELRLDPIEWKPVIGWEDLYSISSAGDVYSIRKSRLLKNSFKAAYYSITLCRNKHQLVISTHRLVALNFIPNPLNKPCVNHINGNKLDNRVSNLEWVTYSENEQHSHRCLGKKIVHSKETIIKLKARAKGRDMSKAVLSSAAKRRGKPAANRIKIYQYSLNGDLINEYPSLVAAALAVNGVPCAFWAIKTGRLKTYKNYKWKLEN